MALKQSIAILAQTSDGKLMNKGISDQGDNIIALDPELALLGLVRDVSEEEAEAARLAVDILLDDMQINLNSAEFEKSSQWEQHSFAARCLQESYENINDFLIQQGQQQADKSSPPTVDLTALQFIYGQCSFILSEAACCLHFHDGDISSLMSDTPAGNTVKTTHLGVSTDNAFEVGTFEVSTDDLVMISSHELLKLLGQDFIRVTLSRFHDNAEMIIRQIISKAQRLGMSELPSIIIVTVLQTEPSKKGWLERFR